MPHRPLTKEGVLPIWNFPPPMATSGSEQSREGEFGMPQLTHPDFAKLPRPKFPDQLERLPGDFPFILGPEVLRCRVHTGQGQLLTQTVPFLCFRKEKRVLVVTRADLPKEPHCPTAVSLVFSLPWWQTGFDVWNLHSPRLPVFATFQVAPYQALGL